jgi:2-oxoisovalerate dehydrogenase E2 component (dihydrolipoyl transacylase)
MFKSMTKSLSIPHFLFTDEITFSSLASLRKTLNDLPSSPIKLSFLPFVIKAVSIALQDFPLLNAKVEVPMDGGPPKLIMREKHNIGVAMDTPQGLLVPNIKNVAALSVYEIAQELQYLQGQAKAAKLSSAELTGGTITVSNIGSIGGTYTAPLLVQNEVAIVAMGKLRVIPAFDAEGNVVKKTVGNFSWSADHRVIDGATMARMGERVRALVEEPGLMAVSLR